jgi:hypothetical protein
MNPVTGIPLIEYQTFLAKDADDEPLIREAKVFLNLVYCRINIIRLYWIGICDPRSPLEWAALLIKGWSAVLGQW